MKEKRRLTFKVIVKEREKKEKKMEDKEKLSSVAYQVITH